MFNITPLAPLASAKNTQTESPDKRAKVPDIFVNYHDPWFTDFPDVSFICFSFGPVWFSIQLQNLSFSEFLNFF